MLKIKDETGKVVGVLKDDDNEPEMEEKEKECKCNEDGTCDEEECCCEKEGE